MPQATPPSIVSALGTPTPRSRRFGALGLAVVTAGCLLLALVPGSAAPASASGAAGSATGSGATAAAASAPGDLVFSTFNIRNVVFDADSTGEDKNWRDRRAGAVSTVLATRPAVLGLQEANQSLNYADQLDYGSTQFLDFKNALNQAGGSYALTNEFSYNCAKSTSSTNCAYQDRGAAQDNRILYDTARVTLQRQGSYLYEHQTAGRSPRYLAWAVLQNKATGRDFFVASTHLDPYTVSSREGQWDELIAQVNKLKGSLPTIVMGDFNTSKYSSYAGTYLAKMKAAGYGDVLNQQAGTTTPAKPVRAQSTTNTWINSFNGFKRDMTGWAYEDNHAKIGNSIDWIFAGNALPVKHVGVSVAFNASTLKVSGVFPSDHNMVSATLTLPGGTATTPPATTAATPVVVGTQVVHTAADDGTVTATKRPWRERRPAVVADILSRNLGVVGIQDASPSEAYRSRYDAGSQTQYLDLRNALNQAGRDYQLTAKYAYDCAALWTTSSCVAKQNYATGDTRMLYDADRYTMVGRGALKYSSQVAGTATRYLQWATFSIRSSGQRFLVANTRLSRESATVRTAQWKQAAAKIAAVKGSLPVIALGDFAATKAAPEAKTLLPLMRQSGFGDALGQQYASYAPAAKRAATITNAWISSDNPGFSRDVASFSRSSATELADSTSWIFVDNALSIRDWKTMVRMSSSKQLTGVLPSDHQLLTSTVLIP